MSLISFLHLFRLQHPPGTDQNFSYPLQNLCTLSAWDSHSIQLHCCTTSDPINAIFLSHTCKPPQSTIPVHADFDSNNNNLLVYSGKAPNQDTRCLSVLITILLNRQDLSMSMSKDAMLLVQRIWCVQVPFFTSGIADRIGLTRN